MTRRALSLLDADRNDAYEIAIAELPDDTREWWMRLLSGDPDEPDEDEAPYGAEAGDLRRFLEEKVLAWFETRRKELANRPLIREQAFGEAFDPGKLDQLGRYEVHLDRKFERMLTVLLRLKELRKSAGPD
jgi:hypothetical protein